MALFQPTNITPSIFSGIGSGTVDITQPLQISWQVNGNSPMVAYKADIMQNDANSTVMYSTGKVTLSAPFYGVNYKGEEQYFSFAIPSATLTGAGMTNGYEKGYKLQITQWWSDTESIAQTSASYFITRSAPSLTLADFPNPMNKRRYTFQASYAQAQGDAMEWARWEIMQGSGGGEALLDTGDIYGTGELKADFDGFFSGETYMIRCTIQTENGVQATTGWVIFTAQYDEPLFEGAVSACALCNADCVQVTFPSGLYIMGEATGDYTIIANQGGGKSCVLSTASDGIAWDTQNGEPLAILAPFSIAWTGTLSSIPTSGVNLLALAIGDTTLTLTAKARGITAMLGTATLFFIPRQLYTGDSLAVILGPTGYQLRVTTYSGTALYPSDTLYPGETVYPSAGKPEDVYYSGDVASWQEGISAITITGPQTCNYVWAISGEFQQSMADAMLATQFYTPAFDEYTQFLCTFDSGLSAGSLSAASPVNAIAVYREEVGSNSLRHLADLPIGQQTFRDYGVCNQTQYRYSLIAAMENDLGSTTLTTNIVTPFFWDYTLLCCREDENGVYRVQAEYRFALDVSSGQVSNNNNPTLQKNFTPYPTRQPSAVNYRSGTLSAYTGSAKNGKYADSLAVIDELLALSTSSDAKFLKNRKGEIMRVEISAPITMQTSDKYAQQPVKIQLPWAEIGSMDGVSIISQETDAFYSQVSGDGVFYPPTNRLQSKTAIPGRRQIVITPDEGYSGLSSVTIEAIPANYADLSVATAQIEDVRAGKKFGSKDGIQTGQLPEADGQTF